MRKVRAFSVSVSYRDANGQFQEEAFPVQAFDYETASRMAFDYVLRVLRYDDFELRLVGA